MGNANAQVTVVADRVSKRYTGVRMPLYPPMVSVFHRGRFRRGRETEQYPRAGSRADRGPDLEEDDLDDEDLDGDDDLDEGTMAPPGAEVKPFWALKDISFHLREGEALGILGGPAAGKSTLLRVLAGRTPPTEGRVQIREPVVPPPAELTKSLAFTDRGAFPFSLVLGCRMLGLNGRLVKQYRDEIVELARPERGPDGKLDSGTMNRLAVATAVILPASVILLEEMRAMDEEFIQEVRGRLRQRLRNGTSLVLASRKPDLVRQLCDEVMHLDRGRIVDRGRVKGVIRRRQDSRANQPRPPAGKLTVPAIVPAFNASGALLSATLHTATGRTKRIDAADDEVIVEIHFGTAVPDVEANCGIVFAPRSGEGPGIRLVPSEPLRFSHPGNYVLVARAAPGTLRGGAYDVCADAIVSHPAEQAPSVIVRDIGRVRVRGDGTEPPDRPVPHWDGRLMWAAETEWSVE